MGENQYFNIIHKWYMQFMCDMLYREWNVYQLMEYTKVSMKFNRFH